MNTRKKKTQNYILPLIAVVFYILNSLFVLPEITESKVSIDSNNENIYITKPDFELPEVDGDRIKVLNERYAIEKNTQTLYEFLRTKNSIFENREFSKIIVEESMKVDADFRVVAGIMMKESGYCNAPYKTYNCFGYLNKVQYGSFDEAFRALVPKVAKYVKVYNLDTYALGQAYGAVNWQDWGAKVYAVAISMEKLDK